MTTRSDELFKTISEIAESSSKAKSVIDNATSSFLNVSEVVQELGQAAKEIDVVTDSIRDVSEQVDLLALNATIEAARAGDAGKGFAVVAQEIKELAKQTASATNNADEKLRWMQSKEVSDNIARSAQASERVSDRVRDVDDSTQQIHKGINTPPLHNSIKIGYDRGYQ